MPIALGGNQINKAYLGGNEIQKMYLGADLVFDNTVPSTELRPIMTNFRILESEPNNVYFDTPLGAVTATTYTGFTISNKTINGIFINAGQTTGHYLTVTSPFNYWDNMLVWYNGTDIKDLDGNDVYPFYQEDVYNSAPEPVGTGNQYFVKVGGNDSLDGLSEANAWGTLGASDSKLSAGDTLNVKVGNYGADFMNFQYAANGLVDNPIKIIGYQVTPGDITTNYWDYGTPISSSEMPLIDGANGGSNTGIGLSESSYYIFKNIQVTNTRYGATMFGSGDEANNITFDRCNFTEQGNTATSGYGIYSTLEFNSKITINSCGFLNATMINAIVTGNNNSIRNCKSYADSDDNAADYHYILSGRWNKIVSSHCEHVGNLSHSGHGISIKNQLYTTDPTFLVERCLAKDCTVKNVNGALEFRHSTVQYCYANNVTLDGSGLGVNAAGLVFRDGASFNVFDKGEIREAETDSNWYGAIYFTDTTEDGGYGQTLEGNEVRNTLIVEGGAGEYCINYGNNTTGANNYTVLNSKFYNNTFANHTNLHKQSSEVTVTGTEFTNNIFDNITNLGNGQGATFLNNLFFGGFAAQGTGAITIDPDLDANYQPQATFTDIDVPKISGINYGKNGNERQDDTTVGAILSAEEVASQPPVGDYDFYVSATGTGDGLTSDTPMSFADSQTTINSMTAGQSIAYKGGDEFYGQLTLTGKSGITITSYDGKASITGAEPIVGWSDQGGNVWTKDVTGKVINNVFKDGISANNTRMPLPDMYTINTKNSNTSLICNELGGIGYPDIVGATLYTESNQWTMQNREVTAFNSTTGEITISGTENILEGNLFTIHNHKNLLASQNDWAYEQGTDTLYVYSVGEPTGITATTTIGNGINITSSSGVTVKNIEVHGYSGYGISFLDSDNLVFDDNYIHDNNLRGISEGSLDNNNEYITFTNNIISRSDEHGIRIKGMDCLVDNNIISDIGMQDYKTWTNSGYTVSLAVSSNDGIVSKNTLSNSGYNAINVGDERVIVKENYITNTNVYLPDGGAIYTYSTTWVDTNGNDSQILNNTIINPVTPRFRANIGLIYMDDRSQGQLVDGNTVQGGKRCIFLHNTRNVTVTNNVVYKPEQYGIGISEDTNVDDGDIYGNTISNNTILIAKSNYETAPVTLGSSYSNSDFGTFQSNTYFSMGNYSIVNIQNQVDYTVNDQFPQENTLSQWQAKHNDDSLSTNNTTYYDTFTADTEGQEIITNGDFASGVGGWSADDGSVSDGGGYLIGTPSSASCTINSSDAFDIVTGEIYMIQFDVKSNAVQRMHTYTVMSQGPYYNLNLSSILADTTWKTYRFYNTYEHTSNGVRLKFYTDGTNQIHLDNVSIKKITLGEAPQNSFLAYNETSVAKDVTLPTGTWDSIDGSITGAIGAVGIDSYSSKIMIKQ